MAGDARRQGRGPGAEGRRCRVTGGVAPRVGGGAAKTSVEDEIQLLRTQHPLQGNRREEAGRLSAKSKRRCRVTGGRGQDCGRAQCAVLQELIRCNRGLCVL